MFDLATMLLVAVVFFIAGTVKGVIGLGLPSVSLGLLTASIGLTPAMALLLAPSFATNLWQAVVGGNGEMLVRRLWPFFFAATATVGAGAALSAYLDLGLLSALLGVLLAAYALIGLCRPRFSLPRRFETWLGPGIGVVNGVLTGMTGSFVVPGVLFLQAIGLGRDALVQAMGMLFTLSTLALGLALGGRALLSAELILMSCLAVLPALAGMVIGQRIRPLLSEARFRQVFFVALAILGCTIVIRSLGR